MKQNLLKLTFAILLAAGGLHPVVAHIDPDTGNSELVCHEINFHLNHHPLDYLTGDFCLFGGN